MSNVVDFPPKPRLRIVAPTIRQASAIARYVKSFAHAAPTPADALPALKLKAWVEETIEKHGPDHTLELLRFQVERLTAIRDKR